MRAPCPASMIPASIIPASITLALTILAFTAFTSAQAHVSFPAPDGYRLNADLYGDGLRAVVLVHGGRFNKESWKKQAQVLSDSGFRVLAIDFRGYGQTKAGTTTVDDNSYPDVLTAVRYLHSTGSNSVSVVGASMGGDATADAVMSGARTVDLDRVNMALRVTCLKHRYFAAVCVCGQETVASPAEGRRSTSAGRVRDLVLSERGYVAVAAAANARCSNPPRRNWTAGWRPSPACASPGQEAFGEGGF